MTKFFKKKSLVLALAATLLVSGIGGLFAANGQPTFTDVPETHWAYSYVEKAAENGWVTGVGNGKFGVDNQVTYAELSTMLVRAFMADYLEHYGGRADTWYKPYCATLDASGVSKGTRLYSEPQQDIALQPINRYEMAQLLYNLLKYKKIEISYNAATVQAGIPDWASVPSNYQEALAAIVGAGMITGVDSTGTFNGNGLMTRGQAAVVMCRMAEVVETGEVVNPTEPTNPTEPGESDDLGQKLPSGATAAAGVLSSIGKDDAYPTYGNSDVVSPNGYFTGATDVNIGNSKLQYEFLDLVNEARVAEGHEPLTWGSKDSMEEYTLIRCNDLVSDFSHDRPKGAYAGEVIAHGQASVREAFNDWMNSAGHKRTLMSDTYSYMTAARAGNYWVICLWSDSGVKLVEKWSSNNYDYSAYID